MIVVSLYLPNLDHHIPQFAILPDVKVHELLTHEYLTLKCVIDANVYSNVKITKDGVNLRYNGRIEGHSMVFVYRKEDVQTIDSGIYECFALSKRDRSKVRKRSIRVKVRSKSCMFQSSILEKFDTNGVVFSDKSDI